MLDKSEKLTYGVSFKTHPLKVLTTLWRNLERKSQVLISSIVGGYVDSWPITRLDAIQSIVIVSTAVPNGNTTTSTKSIFILQTLGSISKFRTVYIWQNRFSLVVSRPISRIEEIHRLCLELPDTGWGI